MQPLHSETPAFCRQRICASLTHSRALPVPLQTIGGAVATNSHGSSLKYGSLSSQVGLWGAWACFGGGGRGFPASCYWAAIQAW